MFDLSKLKLGSDKKRELKDNIKEIRGLIESETADSEETQSSQQDLQGEREELRAPDKPGKTSPPERTAAPEEDKEQATSRTSKSQTRPPEKAAPQPPKSETQQPTNPRSQSIEPPKTDKPPAADLEAGPQRPETGAEPKEKSLNKPEKLQPTVRSEEETAGEVEEPEAEVGGQRGEGSRQVKQVPKLAQTKKFGKSHEEEGPLFIEEEDFYAAEDIISELNSLSNQLSSSLRDMENTLLEDEELAKDIQETISVFEETSEELKGIFTS